jgi:ATP/maltotriose-dependent transcriptional regulator MalT
LADSHQVSPLTRIRTAACHVQVALAQGDLAVAQFWAEQVTEPTDTSLLYPCLGLTPVGSLLARHEKTQAATRLNELYETASQKGCGAGMVEVRALQTLAADTPGEAFHFLLDALKRAQPEGFIRTFVDKGEPMRLLIADCRSQIEKRMRSAPGEDLEQVRAYATRLLAAFSEHGAVPAPQSTIGNLQSEILLESLSERELEILRLLAEGLSNREIAERLVISVGTTKSHVHHILEKLGSDSRMQAVAKARGLGLL